MRRTPQRAAFLAACLALVLVVPASVSASHSWGGYHWARTANPFTLKLGDNVNSTWDSYLGTASSDWSLSSVLHTTVVAPTSVKRLCSASTGTVQVCNAKYGNTGWLGIAQIWVNGVHITKGTVKVNDTYFSTGSYNTPAWRQMVMCQEVGHTFGLDHQDESFGNPDVLDQFGAASCMDYTDDPSQNQHPNQHDFDQLVSIYGSHFDSTTTVAAAPAAGAAAAADEAADAAWGNLVVTTNGGHGAWYARDLGAGNAILTHVFWADR